MLETLARHSDPRRSSKAVHGCARSTETRLGPDKKATSQRRGGAYRFRVPAIIILHRTVQLGSAEKQKASRGAGSRYGRAGSCHERPFAFRGSHASAGPRCDLDSSKNVDRSCVSGARLATSTQLARPARHLARAFFTHAVGRGYASTLAPAAR